MSQSFHKRLRKVRQKAVDLNTSAEVIELLDSLLLFIRMEATERQHNLEQSGRVDVGEGFDY